MPRTSVYQPPQVGAGLGELARFVRQILTGRINVAGEVTVAGYTSTTVISDANFTFTTELVLIPRDADGAALNWWLASRGRGSITIGHEQPGHDLTFGYVAVG